MGTVPGLVDINVEQQTEIPQIVIRPKPTELATFGKTPGDLARFVEMAFVGQKVGVWWENGRVYDVVAKLPDVYRTDFERLAAAPVDVRGERFAELSSVAHVDKTMGPNLINRENVQRRIVVTANVSGRDLRGAAEDVLAAVDRLGEDAAGLPGRARRRVREPRPAASRTIVALSVARSPSWAWLALLFLAFRSLRDALLVLFNLPLALVGGAIAVAWGGGVLTIASLVGFITLFGIATRNGIMMITHYRHLLADERVPLRRGRGRQGSVDRLVPILMTALTAALALIPIVLATGEPGNEIQAPMSAVILGRAARAPPPRARARLRGDTQ